MSTHVEGASSHVRTRKALSTILGALLLLLFVAVLSLLCGATFYSPQRALSDPESTAIIVDLRLPRTLCAALVGAGLSIVGATYQAIFRNYLASPFTLGVSSGAALVASAALLFGFCSSRYAFDIGIFALVGAIGSILIITMIHKCNRKRDTQSLLLVGIVFSFFCSSVMSLLQYLADYSQLFQVTRWMMGGIPTSTWSDLGIGAIAVGVVMGWALRNARALDLMLFGDDFASIKGVNVSRLTQVAFVFTSVVVGWVVAQCGVIGFVGIIVPAIARLLVGLAHTPVLILSAILGALLVLLCDVAGRVVVPPFEVPAGVFTAVIGGPVFVLLMLRPTRR
jgi:iron complex transport system permease protein